MKFIKKSFLNLGMFLLLIIGFLNIPWQFLIYKTNNNKNNENIVSLYQGESYEEDVEYLYQNSFHYKVFFKSYKFIVDDGTQFNLVFTFTQTSVNFDQEKIHIYGNGDGSTRLIDKVYEDSLKYDTPQEYNIKFSALNFDHPQVNGGTVDSSGNEHLSSKVNLIKAVKPSIRNLYREKILLEPKKVKLSWIYDDAHDATIVDNKTTITGTGIESGSQLISIKDNSLTLDNLDYNTIYDDWKINITYKNSIDEVETTDVYEIPPFISYEEDMQGITTFTYGDIINNQLTINLNIDGLTGNNYTYTNFTFISESKGINESRTVSINDNGNYTFNNIPLETGKVYDDLIATITVVDSYDKVNYDINLPLLTNGPKINNFIATIDDTSGLITLTWDIDDPENFFTSFVLYNEKNDRIIKNLSEKEITEKKITIIGLEGDQEFSLSIRGEWTSPYGSGTTISNVITFTTIWGHSQAPTIISVAYLNLTATSVEIEWNLLDEEDVLTKVYLYDENNNLIIHEMTEDELINKRVTIDSLTPITDYSWTLRIDWDDPHYSEEAAIISDSLNFSTPLKELALPTIDSFTYENLSSDKVTLNWTITDDDNTLKAIYLYDLDQQKTIAKDLSLKSDTFVLDNLVEKEEYNLELRGTWLDPNFTSGEITSENPIHFIVPITPKIIPTIDSFSFDNLSSGEVTINWTITDNDNLLQAIYLYDVDNDIVFDNNLNLDDDSVILNNLIEGQEYNLELRGSWLDPNFTSDEIKSEKISFKIPYSHKIAPTIENFKIKNQDDTSITFTFKISDADYLINKVILYDNLKKENIYQLTEKDIANGEITINYDSRKGNQEWLLMLFWEEPYYEPGIITSNSQNFTINNNINKWIYLLIIILLIIIVIITIAIIFFNSKKDKVKEIEVFS